MKPLFFLLPLFCVVLFLGCVSQPPLILPITGDVNGTDVNVNEFAIGGIVGAELKVLCIKSGGYIGTCSTIVGADGTCNCG